MTRQPATKRELSWTPRRRGETYCAPACGRGCTFVEHQRAKREAAKLLKRLGPGWKARVWENLGWHLAVNSLDGFIKIHTDRAAGPYHVFLGPGEIGGTWVKHGNTINAALRAVAEAAREELVSVGAMVRSIDAAIVSTRSRKRVRR